MRWMLSCLVFTIIFMVTALSVAGISGSLEEQKIIERLKPEGQVNVEGGGAAAAKQAEVVAPADIGKHRYEQTCKLCHETGLADAPKFGNKGDWSARMGQGMQTLIQHAIHGYKAMPPKGSCNSCSDEEIQKAVEYMVNHSK
jgi:cytochrome c5